MGGVVAKGGVGGVDRGPLTSVKLVKTIYDSVADAEVFFFFFFFFPSFFSFFFFIITIT